MVCADSGYHSEANLKQLEDKGIEAYIPDHLYRQRDPRYDGQEQHTAKPDALWDKSPKPADKPKLFRPCEFQVAADQSHCICPAGKRLYRNGGNCNIGGTPGDQVHAARSATAKIVRSGPSVYAILSAPWSDRWPSSWASTPRRRRKPPSA